MKKIILIIIGLVIIVGGGVLISASSLLKIPVFSNIFYSQKISDLGIQVNPEAAESFGQKTGISSLEIIIPPFPPEPRTIEVTDLELTSWVNKICSEIKPISPPGPITLQESREEPKAPPEEIPKEPSELQESFCLFENFQTRFEPGRYIISAHILKPIEGDVTVFGTLSKRNEKSIDLEFEKVYMGNLPIPEVIREMVEKKAEKKVNEILKGIEYLRIDDIQILEGRVVFKGVLSFKIPEF